MNLCCFMRYFIFIVARSDGVRVEVWRVGVWRSIELHWN